MGFLERHKALVITILSMLLLLLLLFNISLHSSTDNFTATIIELEHLEDLNKETESSLEDAQREERQASESSLRTHQAFNQEQEARAQNFQDRLEEIFERNSARQQASDPDASSSQDGDYSLDKNSEQSQERSDGDNTGSELSQQTGSLRNSTISFSLVGRAARSIPNPVYTCSATGKIVVNIRVNDRGEVSSTGINKASSTSSNQCLEEKALEYASKARFSQLPGRNNQQGTITYHFQG